jgi:hypothetical protein
VWHGGAATLFRHLEIRSFHLISRRRGIKLSGHFTEKSVMLSGDSAEEKQQAFR